MCWYSNVPLHGVYLGIELRPPSFYGKHLHLSLPQFLDFCVCINACMCTCAPSGGQKRELDLLELRLEAAMNCHTGAKK